MYQHDINYKMKNPMLHKECNCWSCQLKQPWIFDMEYVRLEKRRARYMRRRQSPKMMAKHLAYEERKHHEQAQALLGQSEGQATGEGRLADTA